MLMSLKQIEAHLRKRLASRQWWLIVSVEGRGLSFLAQLKDELPAGDLEALLIPAWMGLLGIFLARKVSLTRSRITAELDRVGLLQEAERIAKDEEVDVLVLADGVIGPEAIACLSALVQLSS